MLIWSLLIVGQQNRLMYHLHEIPESNLLNPAVPMPCGWVIGLPVISSTHFNLGNNVASFNQIFTNQGNGNYYVDFYDAESYVRRRNFASGEFHTQWLGLGLRRGDWSYYFSITEKSNFIGTIPKDLITLALHGNSAFIGKTANLKGTSAYANYYREYALSVSKRMENDIYFGARVKLLFGKLNATVKRSTMNLKTADPNYDIMADGHMVINTSMPVYTQVENGQIVDWFVEDEWTYRELLMNNRNPGLGFDFGVVYPLDERTKLSASITDLGFIYWSSYIHNYDVEGNFSFNGVNENYDANRYWDELRTSIRDSIDITTNSSPYVTYLPTKLSAGVNRQFNSTFFAGILGDLQMYRTKWVTGITVSGGVKPANNVTVVGSWSYQYNTLKNIGLGVVLGKNPVQFYLISDNINSFFWPYGTRNVNLRFGINIIPGCRKKEEEPSKNGSGIKSLEGACDWANEPGKKRRRR